MFRELTFAAATPAAQLSPGYAALMNLVLLLGLTADVFLIYAALARWVSRQPLWPARRAPLPQWTASEALAVVFAAILIGVAIGGITLAAAKRMNYHKDQADQLLLLSSNTAMPIVEIALIAALLRWRGVRFANLFGAQPHPTARAFAVGALAFIAVIPPAMFLHLVYLKLSARFNLPVQMQEPIRLLRTEPNEAIVGWLMAFSIFVAPLVEEIVYRGFIYPAVKKQFGFAAAVIVVSLGFALMHFNAAVFAPLFLLGVVLALAFEATGSLWASILTHMLFNSFSAFAVLQLRQ